MYIKMVILITGIALVYFLLGSLFTRKYVFIAIFVLASPIALYGAGCFLFLVFLVVYYMLMSLFTSLKAMIKWK